MHLTDDQLNEYLDKETDDQTLIASHLSTCPDCAARLTALQALFVELDSLPEETLSNNLAARITLPSKLPTVLPRSLRLAVTVQAALTMIAIIVAAPFVLEFTSPYLVSVQMPSFTKILFQAQSQWVAWLDLLSQFQMPTLPEIPAIEVSSLYIALVLAVAFILWLVGNGLLLRKQMK